MCARTLQANVYMYQVYQVFLLGVRTYAIYGCTSDGRCLLSNICFVRQSEKESILPPVPFAPIFISFWPPRLVLICPLEVTHDFTFTCTINSYPLCSLPFFSFASFERAQVNAVALPRVYVYRYHSFMTSLPFSIQVFTLTRLSFFFM